MQEVDFIASINFLNSQEKESLKLVLNALKKPYKDLVMFDLERRLIFDTSKPTRQALFLKIQEIIINLADKKARTARLDTKGKFITEYEALRLKRKYFIAEILDIKDEGIKYFLQELVSRAMD